MNLAVAFMLTIYTAKKILENANQEKKLIEKNYNIKL